MSRKDNQIDILSFEDLGILIDKYSRIIKRNYAEILSKDFDGETWKTEGIKVMSYIKIFEILKSELEKNIVNFEKEGNLDMLNEAKEELEKADIKIIPIIEEIRKVVYYFEIKFKKIGKFRNTYDEILIILKKEVEKEKECNDFYRNFNRKFLKLEKQFKKVENEVDKNYYIGKYDKQENLINNNDKENDFIEIKIREEENKEEKIKVEEIKEEEFKEMIDENFSLEQVKNWLIKNWFIFIFLLFFFMIGILIGKI